jgi:hypothetical protein
VPAWLAAILGGMVGFAAGMVTLGLLQGLPLREHRR